MKKTRTITYDREYSVCDACGVEQNSFYHCFACEKEICETCKPKELSEFKSGGIHFCNTCKKDKELVSLWNKIEGLDIKKEKFWAELRKVLKRLK